MGPDEKAKLRTYCWQWIRNRPLARTCVTRTFTVKELRYIAGIAEKLKKPRLVPLLIKRKRYTTENQLQ